MSTGRPDRSEPFLSRWSRRKLAAARDATAAETPAPPTAATAPGSAAAAVAPVPAAAANPPIAAPALPSVEALTFESDFTAFLQPGVEPAVQRAALRKLLHDPRFNVMDGLDVYIDDYTKPSPLDPAIARMLADAQNLFVPRVDAAQAGPPAAAIRSAADPAGMDNTGTPPLPADAASGDADRAAGAVLAGPQDARTNDAVEQVASAQRRVAGDPQQAPAHDEARETRAETRS